MASTLADYFGQSLAAFIGTNATAIGSNLGIPAAHVQDPDRLLAALVKRIKGWLTADGTTDNLTEIFAYGGNGAPSKHFGRGDRDGLLGYRYWFVLWNLAIDPALIVALTLYQWILVNGIWEQAGDLQDEPSDPGLLVASTTPPDLTGKTIFLERYYSSKPTIEIYAPDLVFSGIFLERYYSTIPTVEVI